MTTWINQQPNETPEQWHERLMRDVPHNTLAMLSYGALPGAPGESTPGKLQDSWKSAKAVGISRQEFEEASPVELAHKINTLERARARPEQTAMVKAVMDEILGEQGMPGRPLSTNRESYYHAWIELGKPAVTNALCRTIAKRVLGSEYSDATSDEQKKICGRVRSALVRAISSATK